VADAPVSAFASDWLECDRVTVLEEGMATPSCEGVVDGRRPPRNAQASVEFSEG
jgi:hypothetical protein